MSLCGQESCDKDCVLTSWSAYGPCSAACGGGRKEKRRNIVEPSKGQGFCPAELDSRRFDKQVCNPQACPAIEPICQAKVDLLFLIDMSGTVGQTGLEKQVQFVTGLVDQLDFDFARVGIILFSSDVLVWAPLTDDQDWLLARLKLVPNVWQGQLTATAQALSKAKTLLTEGGRPSAASIVLVLTDGMPTGPLPSMDEEVKTPQVASELRKVARLMFVSIGSGINGKNIQKVKGWATDAGDNNNFAQVPNFDALPLAVDDLLIKMCPEIKGLVDAPDDNASVVNPTTTNELSFPLPGKTSTPAAPAVAADAAKKLMQTKTRVGMHKARYGVVTWGDDIPDVFDDKSYGPAPDLSIY